MSRTGRLIALLASAQACGGGRNDATIDARPSSDSNAADSSISQADAATDAGQVHDAAPDSAPVNCTSLAPQDDGTGAARQALIISEIGPRYENVNAVFGNYIEVFNNTSTTIDLSTSDYYLYSATTSAPVAAFAPAIMVPPGGYAVIGFPTLFTDNDAGGEIALYLDGTDFTDGSKLMDFVCWGVNPHASVKQLAEDNGKWEASAACPGAITMAAIHRKPSTDGNSASDYDVSSAPSPISCP